MQVVIWIFGVLGVIGAGIGLGYLLYYLFWQKYAIRREESVSRSEFEELKATLEAKLGEGLVKPSELEALRSAIESVEAKLGEGLVKPSELEALRSAIESVEAKLGEGLVKPSELEALRSAIASVEAKLRDDYVTLSQFDRFREAIREVM
ncbi:hypothetical protein ES708_03810 [subsurface metagenome]